jgi:hypothetical protein
MLKSFVLRDGFYTFQLMLSEMKFKYQVIENMANIVVAWVSKNILLLPLKPDSVKT